MASSSSSSVTSPLHVLVCGVPGVGKTTFSRELAQRLGLRHVEISRVVEEHSLFCSDEGSRGRDEARNCSIFDEEKVADWLDENCGPNFSSSASSSSALQQASSERTQNNHKASIFGGCVFDFHSAALFDLCREVQISLVVVLHADTSELGRRLERRGYSESKIRENIECEIFQVVTEEAHETFGTKGGRQMMDTSDSEGEDDEDDSDEDEDMDQANAAGSPRSGKKKRQEVEILDLHNDSLEQMETHLKTVLEKCNLLHAKQKESTSAIGGA
ncbi:unnamed protein product [Amoebophrya sp. A25]|nr:unnamed protein product [Amoebophrya sp. A25]|eukprot:GSA25T00026793001.1